MILSLLRFIIRLRVFEGRFPRGWSAINLLTSPSGFTWPCSVLNYEGQQSSSSLIRLSKTLITIECLRHDNGFGRLSVCLPSAACLLSTFGTENFFFNYIVINKLTNYQYFISVFMINNQYLMVYECCWNY